VQICDRCDQRENTGHPPSFRHIATARPHTDRHTDTWTETVIEDWLQKANKVRVDLRMHIDKLEIKQLFTMC